MKKKKVVKVNHNLPKKIVPPVREVVRAKNNEHGELDKEEELKREETAAKISDFLGKIADLINNSDEDGDY